MIEVKVCGNRDARTFEALLDTNVNFLGLIRVSRSPRSVDDRDLAALHRIFESSKASAPRLVGVVENPHLSEITKLDAQGIFSVFQFHGTESPQFIETVRRRISPSTEIWKAVSLSTEPPPDSLRDYGDLVSSFVFDGSRGGSGIAFDWMVLNDYSLSTPFFLAGGVSPTDVTSIRRLASSQRAFRGVDVNSRFEITPGTKNISAIATFIEELRQ